MTKKKEEEVFLGWDPEVFVKSKKTGAICSAHLITKGTKENPVPLVGTDGGFVQADGVGLEFNTKPANNPRLAVLRLREGFRAVSALAEEKGYRVVAKPSHLFSKKFFEPLPEETKKLGCDPDYNAWTGLINPSPSSSSCVRSTGCHLHIGWGSDYNVEDGAHKEDCNLIIKILESGFGYYLSYLDALDKGRRRSLYGNWGSHRAKPYGVEWRTISSRFLLLNQEAQILFVTNVYNRVLGMLRGTINLPPLSSFEFLKTREAEIQKRIRIPALNRTISELQKAAAA